MRLLVSRRALLKFHIFSLTTSQLSRHFPPSSYVDPAWKVIIKNIEHRVIGTLGLKCLLKLHVGLFEMANDYIKFSRPEFEVVGGNVHIQDV